METVSAFFKVIFYLVVGLVVLGFMFVLSAAGGILFLIALAALVGYVVVKTVMDSPGDDDIHNRK